MIDQADPPNEAASQTVLDEMNRRLAHVVHARNAAPDPEMGGLSPEQVFRLVYSTWGEANSAIQFNTEIPLAVIESAAGFLEARVLLRAIRDTGGVRATSSQNLPRGFVSDMLPLMCDEKEMEWIGKYRKIMNERDVLPVHLTRIVAQCAGLIRLRAGTFIVPKTKAEILRDERAGELYRCLFVTFFRKYNLAYADPCTIEAHGLQTCVGYTLYRLGILAADWHPVEDLWKRVLLPAVSEDLTAKLRGNVYWTVNKMLIHRLLAPLIQWGLLEGRYESVSKFVLDLKAVRITPLYRAFLRFHLDP